MSISNENNPQSIILDLGAFAADGSNDAVLTHWKPIKKFQVTGVKIMNEDAVAGGATNFATVTLQKKGGNVFATWTSDSGADEFAALTAGEYAAMTLSATEADNVLAATDNIEVEVAQTAAGQVLAGLKVQIDGYYV